VRSKNYGIYYEAQGAPVEFFPFEACRPIWRGGVSFASSSGVNFAEPAYQIGVSGFIGHDSIQFHEKGTLWHILACLHIPALRQHSTPQRNQYQFLPVSTRPYLGTRHECLNTKQPALATLQMSWSSSHLRLAPVRRTRRPVAVYRDVGGMFTE